MNTKHTPTPFKLLGDYIVDDDGFYVAQLLPNKKDPREKIPNGEFIVRAVNSHEDFVRGAKIACEYWGRGNAKSAEEERAYGFLFRALEIIEIAKAEGNR